MPNDETIHPSEWLRRLAERRKRDGESPPPLDLTETSAAAELVRRQVHDDVEKVKSDLDEMLAAEAPPDPEENAAPSPGLASEPGPPSAEMLEEVREELQAEIKRRTDKSERRLRKSLRKEAKAAGKKSAREAVDSATRTLELQVQAAEEELREHIHAQLSMAIQQARKRGEADARRDLERVLERVLADLRSEENQPPGH
ncbi:MAG TPA: hypothetical protein VII45_12370 [Solirubrobacterales bacterium]